MAVETQLLDIPFAGGVDEKTRAELVGPGSFAKLQNLVQFKRGSQQKRLGNTLVGNATLAGGTVPACKRLLACKDELLQTDGLNLYTRSATLGTWSPVSGTVPQLQVTTQPTMALQFNAGQYHVATANGLYVAVAVLPDSNNAAPTWTGWATIVDPVNGVSLGAPTAAFTKSGSATGPTFCLFALGTKVVAVYSNTSANSLFYAWIDLASAVTISAGWQGNVALLTDASNAIAGLKFFDVCVLSPTLFVIAYVNNQNPAASSTTITVASYNALFVQQAINQFGIVVNTVGGGSPLSVAIDGSAADVLLLAYPFNGGTSLQVVGLNPTTLIVTTTATTVLTTTAAAASRLAIFRTGNGAGIVQGSEVLFTGTLYTRQFTTSAGAILPSGTQALANYLINQDSKPFVANGGRLYCTVRPANATTTFYSLHDLLLVDLTQSLADQSGVSSVGYLRVVAHISPRLAYGPTNQAAANQGPIQQPMSVVVVSGTKVVLASASLKNATSASLDLVTLDWAATNLWQPSNLNEGLVLSGSPPSFYDGARVGEIGFFQRPTITSTSFGAGGLSPTVGYRYVGVLEQIDNRGQWHQSNVSDPFPAATSAPVKPVAQGVIVNITTLQCSNRTKPAASANAVRLALYRTTDGGTVYLRVPDAQGQNLAMLNTPTSATLAFPVDTATDLQLGAPLYTQPGIPNVAYVKVTPPAFSCMVAHGDRLIGADGKTVWFSGQSVYGEGYWFADNFQFTVETGGNITALASMDGTLVIFKRNAIALVTGDGPADNGNGAFSSPHFIATDVGCIEPRSVVLTPDGVIFQSLRGLELLTRAGQLAPYFGNAVEVTLTANPVITSATLDEAKGLVRFTCLPTEASATGVELVYNLVFGTWSTSLLGDGSSTGVAAKSSVMVGQNAGTVPVRTWLQSTGNVFQESTTDYRDNGAYVGSVLETGPIKAAGVAGFQLAATAILQAQSLTPHDLTIAIAYDNSPTFAESKTWTAAQIAALVTNNEALGWDFANPEHTSFRLRFTDSTPTGVAVGTGQGPLYFGLQVELGNNGKLMLLPDGNRQ